MSTVIDLLFLAFLGFCAMTVLVIAISLIGVVVYWIQEGIWHLTNNKTDL